MNTIPELSKRINLNAHNKGFWDNGLELTKKLLLIVSEVTEVMEADRINHYCTKEKYDSFAYEELNTKPYGWTRAFESNIKNTCEDELADIAIRLFDLAFEMKIDLERHILMKMAYNETRAYKHGKKY